MELITSENINDHAFVDRMAELIMELYSDDLFIIPLR